MESQYFIYDGIKSTDMDLQIMRINHSGFIETPLWGSANIHESKSRKRIKPRFYGVDRDPIEFAVQLVLVDRYGNPKKWTPQERNRVAGWLVHDEYKSFQTTNDLGKYYYAMAISDTDLNLINSQGYMDVTFRTNSCYAWSPIYVDNFDLSNNIGATVIELENKSNVLKTFNPLIELELANGETNIQIKNLSNGGKTMKFEGLHPNEIVSIDCQNRIIKSNKMNSNPFAKFNVGMKRYYLDLVFGVNQIEITGQVVLRTKMQYPIAQ